MTYQVLARKWRPRTFKEVVGQDHVVRALVNAVDNDRLHHAFLFAGTRGVGKTTLARALAKSLNCERGVSSQPCGECNACREVDEGRFVDLIEVDAASRTKVEDTRELLENVQYAPTRGRYKVYLVDEVHMLSAHSFNALLKTLEEPPPHVKFLLATTDPQKLPVTILSRCLQFKLKRLPPALIAEQLTRIVEAEGVEAEPRAIQALARAADGSMRDGLSLLDQAIAYGGGGLEAAAVDAMLGTIGQGHVMDLVHRLAEGDAQGLLDCIHKLDEQTPDYEGVLADLIGLLHRVALVQLVPGALDETFDDRERIEALAGRLPAEDVQLYYQIALNGQRDLPLAPAPRDGFEMIVLRMLAFRPETGEGSAPASTAGSAAAPRSAGAETGRQGAASASATPAGDDQGAPAQPPAAADAPSSEWAQVLAALKLGGLARELAANCALLRWEDEAVHLALEPSRAGLRSKGAEQRLAEALGEYRGRPTRVVIHETDAGTETPAEQRQREDEQRRREAVDSIEQDRNVQSMRELFDAQVNPDSVQPIDD